MPLCLRTLQLFLLPLTLCAGSTIALASGPHSTPAPSHTDQVVVGHTQNHNAIAQHTPLHGSSHKNAGTYVASIK